MSLSLALSLTPIMSGTIRGLVVLIESTLEHDAACQTLEAQCTSLQAQVDAARAHILQEKTAQRRLRAEIVGFLKERSESRSANSSRIVAAEDVSVAISTPGTSASTSANTSTVTNEGTTPSDVSLSALRRYSQDVSPLVLRAKRRGSSVITPERLDVVVKRRRLAQGVSPGRPSLLERLTSPKLR
ncbi:hypothetical protein GSI_12013 [Ganoderma sinense ZZ0214-1]|uniref:Uncharacterized protein n=1 Tax=Ganoderma sinense ZZ0214-1 TaxID=1077348 RepID=A0A2G8RXP3_9APHY|nr:hypothetical protein GSI_12013 [Ganoderma sinense ZZ0214-1]